MRDVESLGRQVSLPVSDGILIWYVRPGGAAANAGLRGMVQTEDNDIELGDIIVSIDGEKVADQDALYRVLDKHKIGDTVNVEVIRSGRRMSVPVRLTGPVAAPARRRGMEE
jgi:S1-C subfamily serine protease